MCHLKIEFALTFIHLSATDCNTDRMYLRNNAVTNSQDIYSFISEIYDL